MLAIPVIELRAGRIVGMAAGGSLDEATGPSDPASLVQRWTSAGFRMLHVVDLDAVLGAGSNRRQVERILNGAGMPMQLDAGIRDEDGAVNWLSAGARIVLGTRAIEDPAWLRSLVERYPEQIVVSVGVRDGRVITYGLKRGGGMKPEDLFLRLDSLAIAAVIATDMAREESPAGVDAGLFERLAQASAHPVIAAGGISEVEDLRQLAAAGVAGALVKKILYRGLDPIPIAREFNTSELVR